jgi:hypothetical protein
LYEKIEGTGGFAKKYQNLSLEHSQKNGSATRIKRIGNVENNFIYIEAYLNGSMSAAEKSEFEQKLQTDTALRAELEQYRSLNADLDWYFAAKDVASAAALRAKQNAERRRKFRLVIVALLVVLAGLSAYWMFFSNKTVADKPVVLPSILPTSTPEIPAAPTTPQQTTPPPPTTKPSIQKPDNQLIAGDMRPREDLLRNLPPQPIPAETQAFFKQQWAHYTPTVPEKGIWVAPLRQLRKKDAAGAYLLLKKMPESDTTAYLLAVSELMLQRPAYAQDRLYPLMSVQKWKTEAEYLLVWAYLLDGNTDLARGAVKMLPEGFRDRAAMEKFLALK